MDIPVTTAAIVRKYGMLQGEGNSGYPPKFPGIASNGRWKNIRHPPGIYKTLYNGI